MSCSKLLFYLCLSFIFGIFLNSFLESIGLLIFIFSILFIFLIIFKKNVLAISVLFLIFGIIHSEQSIIRVENNELKNFFDKKIEVIGVIDGESRVKGKIQKFTLKIEGQKEKILILTTF